MKIKRMRSSPWRRFRFWLWKLFHWRKWKAQRELFRNLDEMHKHKVRGLDEVLRQCSAGWRRDE